MIAPEGFPACRRLRRHREFVEIYASGKKRHTAHFLLMFFFLQGVPQRTGFAVSRKIGNAVRRNRIKRLLREYFRRLPFCLCGCQLAVIARHGVTELAFSDICQDLNPVLYSLARPDKQSAFECASS